MTTSVVQTTSPSGVIDTLTPFEAIVLGTATFELIVSNSGPSQAREVTVTDTLPSGMSFVSGSFDDEGLGIIPNITAGSLTFAIPTLASGETRVFQFQLDVTSSAIGSGVNSAMVSSTDPDPTTTNNTDSVHDPRVEFRAAYGSVNDRNRRRQRINRVGCLRKFR